MSVKLNMWKLEKFYATEEETLEKRQDRGREGEREREREREGERDVNNSTFAQECVYTKKLQPANKFYILR